MALPSVRASSTSPRRKTRSPLQSQEPFVRLQVVLEQILALVCASHLEIARAGPLRLAFHLIPAVEDLAHLDEPFLPLEPARRLVGLSPRIAFDLDLDKPHQRPA